MTEPQVNQPGFQTPNPEALKEAAQVDSIQEREGATEIETAEALDADSEQLGREVSAEMANSQTTIANLGGH